MPNTLFDWLRERPLVLWTVIAAFVVLNIWVDMHNPVWLAIDVVIVLAVIVAFVRSRFG
jgi:hypothetical protein